MVLTMRSVMNSSGLAGSGEDATSLRLRKAAHEFEGQMMKEMLKPMTDGGGLEGGVEVGGNGSGGALGEFAAEALGQALSQRGGFGIASKIVGELSHSGNRR